MSNTKESFARRCFFSKSLFPSARTEFYSILQYYIQQINFSSSPRNLLKKYLLRKPSWPVLILYYILFGTSCVDASQTYILSYRAQIKNAIVISESYYYSKAMQKVKAHPSKQLTLPSEDKSNTDTLLEKNKDLIVDFLMKQGLHTRSHEKVNDAKSSSLISISIPPTYITVDFNDGYAIITRLILD